MDPTRIAEFLGDVFHDLSGSIPFSTAVDHEISSAPAFRQAETLIVHQCDSDDLTLAGLIRDSWVADSHGVHHVENPFIDWPDLRGQGPQFPDNYTIHNPHIKFATDGASVRLGLRFGPNWYEVKEGPLGLDGVPVSEKLTVSFKTSSKYAGQ